MGSTATSAPEEALLLLLQSHGHKQSTDQWTTQTTFNKILECIFPQEIEATSRQDLLGALSALLEAQKAFISAVHGVQAVVNERLNTFLPINNLPIEIFTRIFEIALKDNTKRPAEHLSKLSLVCRNWKAIIYGTPILWTRIVSGDNWRLALENSGEMPLVVQLSNEIWPRYVNTRRFHDVLRPQTQRFRGFSISGFGNEYEIEPVYPLLEFIHTLHVSGDVHQPVSRLSLDRLQTPNLLHLTLDRFIVPWESDLLSGLETLIILHLTADHEPSLEVVGAVLDRCPLLKVLRIRSNDRSAYGTQALDRPRFHLPLLEELSVKYIPSLVALPAVIEAPRLLELDTTDYINPHNPITAMRTVQAVLFPSNGASAVLVALRNSGTKQVSLWWEGYRGDSRRVWIGNYCSPDDLRSERLPHPITFGFAIHPSLLEETLSSIIEHMAASGFSIAIHVVYEPNLTVGVLDAVDHPAIDALHLYYESYLSTALPYLTRLEVGNGPTPFPNLTSLVAHYRLDAIREFTTRTHLHELVDLYWARRRNDDGSHPFNMRFLDFLYNPKSGRFEEEGSPRFIDPRDLSEGVLHGYELYSSAA